MIYINVLALGISILAFLIARRANGRMEKMRARQSIKDLEIDSFVEAVIDHMIMEFKHDRLSYERVAQLIQKIPSSEQRKSSYIHLDRVANRKSMSREQQNKIMRYG